MSKEPMVQYHWNDPLLLDSQLSEEERLVRDNAKSFAEECLMPRVLQDFRHEQFDRNIIQKMGQAGLLGATLQGYGCAGVNNVCYGLIAREIERIDSGYRSVMSVQSSLVMHPINAFGSEAQKEKISA